MILWHGLSTTRWQWLLFHHLRVWVISWHKLPAAMLMTTTSPCPAPFSGCMSSRGNEPYAVMLMTTIFPCFLLSRCVILMRGPPTIMPMTANLPCPLLRVCVNPWHELPVVMLTTTTLQCSLLTADGTWISWHGLFPAMLMMKTLSCPFLRLCVISSHGLMPQCWWWRLFHVPFLVGVWPRYMDFLLQCWRQ